MTGLRCGLLIVLWCLLLAPAEGSAQTVQRLLVVPFENVSREAQSYWLTEASAVLLTVVLVRRRRKG